MNKLLRALFVLTVFAASSQATTYYVSCSNGSDGNSGLAPAHPWKTIARVNRARFRPGDSVLFRRGDLWRETLQPSSSGTKGHRITYAAYGSGPRPVISGSNVIALERISRAESGVNYVEGINALPAALWNRGTRMMPVAHLEQLRADSQWWYDPDRKRVYFMQTVTSDLEMVGREVNIDNHEQSHILYDSLDLRHAHQGLRLYSWRPAVTDIVLQNSIISTEPSSPNAEVSAGVYASVHTGSFSGITIQNNVFTPYPTGLEHWGVYFVQGVSHFKITGNKFAPAGEDDITIWHSEQGVISDNSGGGNGENTIDVKDSHDIVITGNRAFDDGEYNIVVHGVDSDKLTYNITVEKNHCTRGGQGGELTAGIVLLFTRDSKIRNNTVQAAYGAGIFINDRGIGFGNEISGNLLRNNGTRQTTGAITLEDVSDAEVRNNTVYGQGLHGSALRLEGGPHTRKVWVTENTFYSEEGRMLDVAGPALVELASDNNHYYAASRVIFRWASQDYALPAWRAATRQDTHSRLAHLTVIPQSQLSLGALSK